MEYTLKEIQTIRDALSRGESVKVKIKGKSMFPVLKPGETVLVEGRKPGIGDIAFCVHANTFLCHRVLAICKDKYHLISDYALRKDEPMDGKNVIGVVIPTRARLNKLVKIFYKVISPFCRILLCK